MTKTSVVAMQLQQDLREADRDEARRAQRERAEELASPSPLHKHHKKGSRHGRKKPGADCHCGHAHSPGDEARLALAGRLSLIQRQKELICEESMGLGG